MKNILIKKLDFKDIKLPVKIRGIRVLLSMKIRKTSNPYIETCYEEKHVDLLLTRIEGKRHYVLIKDFNTFMYDHTSHHGTKTFLPSSFPNF